MPTSTDMLFWVLGGAGVVVGLGAVYWALLHDRARGRKRCPRCWYDMGGSPSLTCPECGHEARSERRLGRTRRRWGWAAVGTIAVLAGTVSAAWPRASARGWLSFVPAPVLYLAATADWLPGQDAAKGHVQFRSAAMGETTRAGRWLLVSQCIRTLRHGGDARDRDTAGVVLGWIGAGDRRITPALLVALDDPVPLVRVRAIRSLGMYQADADRVVPALMHVLERGAGEPAEVRTEAMSVLGMYRGRADAAAPLLLAALDDPDPAIAAYAAMTMHRVGVDPGEHLPRLLELLEAAPDGRAQGSVIMAIGRCGPGGEAAVPALVRVLEESEDHWVQEAVVEALGRIGPPAAPVLPAIEAWMQANPRWASHARFASDAIRGEHPSFVAAIGAGLADADPGVRQDAARLLRRLAYSERDRAEVLILLRAALDDPDPDVVIWASTGIAAFGREAEMCLPKLRELSRRGAPLAGFAIWAIERAETRAAGK